MKVLHCFYKIIFIVVTLSPLSQISASTNTENFIAQLKTHYQPTSKVKAFSLTQHYVGHSEPFKSWDYQVPNRYTAFKVIDIDLEKKQYVENVIHRFNGGEIRDEVHFQNNTDSFKYERNGYPYGKQFIKQPMNQFARLKFIYSSNLDFLAVAPLLKEENIQKNIVITTDNTTNETLVTHKLKNAETIEYVFKNQPLRLFSITDNKRRFKHIYENYITVNKLTYAQSVKVFLNGFDKPTILLQNDSLSIIDSIDQAKFTVPDDYKKMKSNKDKTLTSEEIATDLYLLTDASAIRNILFTVAGNNVHLFGTPQHNKSAKKIIEHIQTKFPNKKIASVFVSHPHQDQIAGLLPFAKQGITIQANNYTIAAIQNYPAFKNKVNSFKFETIKHQQQLDNVRFFVLESSLAKRQSFVYFEKEEVIFQSNFIKIARDNTIAKISPSHSQTFIDFINTNELKYQRIVGQSINNNISPELIEKISQSNMM